MFFKIESWNFQVQFEIEFRETSQNFNSIRQPREKNVNNNCLNELNDLKQCEVSRNLFANRCWKFQLSIMKNKKVLFLKKSFFKPLSISKQKALFTVSIFPKVLTFPIKGFAFRQPYANYSLTPPFFIARCQLLFDISSKISKRDQLWKMQQW